MATFADVDRIINKWDGRYAGVQYGGVYQCVAWAAQFSGELNGIGYLPTPKSNGAKDIYEQFAAPLPNGYDRIANTPSFIPQKGDMVVWGAMPSNPYGHVAIANGVGDTNSFQSYDQNWTGGEKVHLVNHNYNYVLGVLRSKNLTAAPAAPGGTMADIVTTDELRIIHSELEGWPLADTHAGKFDAQFNASWGGQPLRTVLWDKWNKDGDWRNLRQTALDYYATKAANDALVADLRKQLADTTKQYQDLLAKPPVASGGIDQATKDTIIDTNTKVSWLQNLLTKIFK